MRFILRIILVGAFVGLVGESWGQTIAWTDGAGSSAWYTNTNWTPNTTSGAWLTNNIAQFNNSGTANTAGINMNTSSLSIGAIEMSSARARILTIGNSSPIGGNLTLNGTSVNSVANTILRNNSANLLTLQDNETGSGKTMGVVLGNGTNNIVSIEGAGGITISSIISGANSLTKANSGSGVLTLTAANTYTGRTFITGGLINANSENVFGANPGSFVADQINLNGGGIQTTTSNITFSSFRGITLGSGGGVFDVVGVGFTMTGLNLIAGSGFLTKSNTGTLLMTGAHTYSGNTNLNAGVIQIGVNSSGVVGSIISSGIGTNRLVINGGTLSSNNSVARTILNPVTLSGNVTLGDATNNGSLTFSDAITISGVSRTVTVNSLSIVDGIIGDGGNNLGLVKTGTAMLTVNGTNTYGGNTTISNGTLNLTGSLSASSAITVSAGATLRGTGTAAGTVLLNGTLSPAGSGTIGTFNTGAETWNNNSVVQIDLNNTTGSPGTINDLLSVTGNLTINATSSIALSGNISNFINSNTYSWTIGTVSGSIIGTANASFDVSGIVNALVGGAAAFTLSTTGGNLILTYAPAATTYTWNNGSCAWLMASWLPSSYPGFAPGNVELARFHTNALSFPSIGINMGTAMGLFELGGIELTSSYPGPAFDIGNNSPTPGILRLNGTIIKSVENSVIRNASSFNFTINDKPASGSCTSMGIKIMDVNLNNPTNNIISVEGTGGIIINSIISGSSPLAKNGSGAGKLTLAATNAYSGAVTVNAGTVQLTNSASLASASSITVKNGGTLQISNSQSLANVTLESGATLNVDATRTLTITGTLTVEVGATISTTGTINYGAGAALVYTGTGSRTTGIEWTSSTVDKVTIGSNAIITINSNRSLPGTLFLINGILDAGTYSFSGTGTTFTIAGTVRTANNNGLINSGASGTTFTGYSNGGAFSTAVLGVASTIDYNAGSGIQNITGAVNYVNLKASGAGTKSPSSTTTVTGTLSVLGSGNVLDAGSFSMGDVGTNLTVANGATYKTAGTGTKPDAAGTYDLQTGSTVEFSNSQVTFQSIRLTRDYYNVTVSGYSVQNGSTSNTSVNLKNGGVFKVTNTGLFREFNDNGLSGIGSFAVNTNVTPTLDAGSTIEYAGTNANQTVTPRSDYTNVTISGGGTKTAASIFSVAGTFTRSGTASLATTSPTYGSGATLAYVDPTPGRTYTAMLEWPTAAPPSNLTINLSGTGTRVVTMPGTRTLSGSVALTAGELSINGNLLTINGAVTGTGTFTGSSTSELTLGGAAGTINFTPGSASPPASEPSRSLKNLILKSSASAKLGSTLDVYGDIELYDLPNHGSLDLDGKNLNLKSNSGYTARIGRLLADGTNLSGASNVTVERYIPNSGRKYRLLTPTVSTPGTIRFNWMNNENNTSAYSNINVNAPGYGVQITGVGGSGSGFDATVTNESSLYNFDNLDPTNYVAIGNPNANLVANKGYFLFIRGDRNTNMTLFNTNRPPWNTALPSSSTTLRATGTIQKGTKNSAYFDQTPIAGTGNLSLITNPYPSAIDWNQVQLASSDITNAYTIWDPNIGNRGGFVSYDRLLGSSHPILSTISQFIQPGQAFFIQAANSNPPAVSIQEVHKVVGDNNVGVFLVDPLTAQNFITALYYTEHFQGNSYRRLADGAKVVYDDSFSKTVDATDIVEMPNWNQNIAIARDGKKLAIEARPLFRVNDTIPLHMNNMAAMDYELEFTASNFRNPLITAKLIDNFTGVPRFLNVTGTTTVPISVTTDPASYASNRFMVVFGPAGGPLPIIVNYFTGAKQNGSHLLNWKVSCQSSPTATMVLERSSDGRSFLAINSITATALRCNDPFSYTDATPLPGTNYYRLKMIDADGKVSYSNIVVLTNLVKSMEVLNISPNPVLSGSFTLRINSAANERADIQISDMQGRILQNQQINIVSGVNTIPVNVQKLPAGSYQLKLINGDAEPEMLRFTIQ